MPKLKKDPKRVAVAVTHLGTPAMRAKARATRLAKRAEMGASYGALITLALMQENYDRGHGVARPAVLKAVTGRPAMIGAHLMVLRKGGFIELLSPGGEYRILRRVELSTLRTKDRRTLAEYASKLTPPADVLRRAALKPMSFAERIALANGGDGGSGGISGEGWGIDKKAVKAALRALRPFANFAKRIDEDAPNEATPILLRGQGVHNSDFRRAADAYAALAGVVDETAEDAPGEESDAIIDPALLPYLQS